MMGDDHEDGEREVQLCVAVAPPPPVDTDSAGAPNTLAKHRYDLVVFVAFRIVVCVFSIGCLLSGVLLRLKCGVCVVSPKCCT